MNFLLLASIICCAIVVYYLSFHYLRRRNFDKYVDLDLKIVFPEKTVIRKSREQGSVILTLNNTPPNFKGLYVNTVKVHHKKFRKRSFHKLYFNLLKKSAVNELAVDLFASKPAIEEVEQQGIHVTVGGYLVKNNDGKTPFEKKIRVKKISLI